MMQILIDTDIILDVLLKREPFVGVAAALWQAHEQKRVQCISAMRSGLDAIVTRDIKDYAQASVPIFSPADFLKQLKGQSG